MARCGLQELEQAQESVERAMVPLTSPAQLKTAWVVLKTAHLETSIVASAHSSGSCSDAL